MNYTVDINNVNEFKNKLRTGNWIVWYFAPWCGHCKVMEPEWNDFLRLKNQHPTLKKNLNCARVSDSMLPRLEEREKPGVNGFPTIKFFSKGNLTPSGHFDKIRTSDNFKEFSLNNLNHVSPSISVAPENKNKSVKRKRSRSSSSNVRGSVKRRRTVSRRGTRVRSRRGSRGSRRGSRGRK